MNLSALFRPCRVEIALHCFLWVFGVAPFLGNLALFERLILFARPSASWSFNKTSVDNRTFAFDYSAYFQFLLKKPEQNFYDIRLDKGIAKLLNDFGVGYAIA
jgi:hypothetical protein